MKAKLRLADRVFTCDEPACGHVQDRDLNAALNLARMAHHHAQVEGIPSYVARIGRFTSSTARRGQVSLVHLDEHSPLSELRSARREDSPESPQRRETLAAA